MLFAKKMYHFLKETYQIFSLVHSEQVKLISNLNPQYQWEDVNFRS